MGVGLACLILTGCGAPRPDASSVEPLLSGPQVRVRVFSSLEFSRITCDISDGALILCSGDGTPLPRPPEARQIYLSLQGGQIAAAFKPGSAEAKAAPRYASVRIRSSDERILFFKLAVPELDLRRNFEGREMEVTVKYGRVCVINQLPLELYVARVLPSEMDPDHFTAEALKAQAVVARTWALRNLKRHSRFGYNFCDSTHCQVYRGRRQVSRRAERAVRQTLGEVLTYRHKPAEAFYHSTCGGNTVSIQDAWGVDPLPYLVGVEDRWKPGKRAYCARSPYAAWDVWMSMHRLQRALRTKGILDKKEKLSGVEVGTVNSSGRVETIRLLTDRRERTLNVDALRRLVKQEFGRGKVLSRFFTIQVQGPFFIIQGKGLGHGVGMCQWGARGMAQHGFGYREILTHYFPGTELEATPGTEAPSRRTAGRPAAGTVKSQPKAK